MRFFSPFSIKKKKFHLVFEYGSGQLAAATEAEALAQAKGDHMVFGSGRGTSAGKTVQCSGELRGDCAAAEELLCPSSSPDLRLGLELLPLLLSGQDQSHHMAPCPRPEPEAEPELSHRINSSEERG